MVADGVASYWSGRSVAVTGATGMVGSWLVRRLVDEGALVTALVLDADPQSELLRSSTIDSVHVVNGRLESFDDVLRLLAQNDASTVFHLGAQTIVGTAQRSPRATLEANVRGTWNVLDAALQLRDRVHSVVIASSDKAYGEQPLPYTEQSRLEGRAPYEVSKSCTDLISTSYAMSYGLPVATARCGNIYGGGDLNWSRLIPGTIRSLLLGQTPVFRSDGTFLRDYLHVDDIVDAYLLLGERGADDGVRGEAFNFSDESPRSVFDIYDAVTEALDGPRVNPIIQSNAPGEIKDQYLDSRKAREVLGWNAGLSLVDGLRKTVAWYRDLLQVGA